MNRTLSAKILFLISVIPVFVGCYTPPPPVPGDKDYVSEVSNGSESSLPSGQDRQAYLDEIGPRVKAFCGGCHVLPRPSSSSREDWVAEVNQGFELYGTSGRNDLEVPNYGEVLDFFQMQAPDEVVMPGDGRDDPSCPIAMEKSTVRLPGRRAPGVTNVRWIDIGVKPTRALVYCDIGSGAVIAHWPLEEDQPTQRLATVFQPVRSEPCDLDGDGAIDLVVADIGEFDANDSDLGRVVWLRQDPETHKFKSIELKADLGRVADVRPGDFDGDGDLDLLVGVFGWRQTGEILLMIREGETEDGLPKFDFKTIDDRSGAVHVPPVDLNGDGHLDFVALISQDQERVEAFLNDGAGNFEKELIYLAPDPAYGSSGIQLVDLDGDGDLDVLFTNGDSFDRGPKPYHSVQWLENPSGYPFVHHELGAMPGVLNAQAADFDNDGDLDVVACSLLGSDAIRQHKQSDTTSVLMLEQIEPGKFKRSALEVGQHDHISLVPGDFDDDGKVDIAVGMFLRGGSPQQPDLSIWWNRGKP